MMELNFNKLHLKILPVPGVLNYAKVIYVFCGGFAYGGGGRGFGSGSSMIKGGRVFRAAYP